MIADTFGAGRTRPGKRSRFVELADRYVGLDGQGRIDEPVLRDDIAQNEMDAKAFGLTVQRAADAAHRVIHLDKGRILEPAAAVMEDA